MRFDFSHENSFSTSSIYPATSTAVSSYGIGGIGVRRYWGRYCDIGDIGGDIGMAILGSDSIQSPVWRVMWSQTVTTFVSSPAFRGSYLRRCLVRLWRQRLYSTALGVCPALRGCAFNFLEPKFTNVHLFPVIAHFSFPLTKTQTVSFALFSYGN